MEFPDDYGLSMECWNANPTQKWRAKRTRGQNVDKLVQRWRAKKAPRVQLVLEAHPDGVREVPVLAAFLAEAALRAGGPAVAS